MKINKSILHILDFKSNLTVISEKELDLNRVNIVEFIEKHLLKITKDYNAQVGIFNSSSIMKEKFHEYKHNHDTFIDISTEIANIIANNFTESVNKQAFDILFSDFDLDGNKYLGILLYENQIAYTHNVTKEDGLIKNEIINHYSILPNPSQKISAYAYVNLDTFEIKVLEKNIYINNKDVHILKELVLDCSTVISEKQTISILKKAAERVAKNNDANNIKIVAKAKNYIIDNAEELEYIEPIEMCREVFFDSPKMQTEFINEVSKAGVPEKININKNFATKSVKMHKIKTDTGIEISIPSNQLQNNEFIEFINNVDGTISIQLKNIGKIINK